MIYVLILSFKKKILLDNFHNLIIHTFKSLIIMVCIKDSTILETVNNPPKMAHN